MRNTALCLFVSLVITAPARTNDEFFTCDLPHVALGTVADPAFSCKALFSIQGATLASAAGLTYSPF